MFNWREINTSEKQKTCSEMPLLLHGHNHWHLIHASHCFWVMGNFHLARLRWMLAIAWYGPPLIDKPHSTSRFDVSISVFKKLLFFYVWNIALDRSTSYRFKTIVTVVISLSFSHQSYCENSQRSHTTR